MLKNMTLPARMLAAFSVMGLIVLIVALVGWKGTNKLGENAEELIYNHLPSVDGLWKINAGKIQIQSAERALFNPEINNIERQNALTQIQSGWNQIELGIKQYESTQIPPEEKEKYAQFRQDLNNWKQVHQNLLQIEQEYNQLGIRNPWERQAQLIIQGQENSPEMARVNAALKLRQRMDTEAMTEESPLFKAADEDAIELLAINSRYVEQTEKTIEQNISQSTFWVLLVTILGSLAAAIFAIYFTRTIAKPLGTKIAGVVGVAERISAGDLTTKVENDGNSNDEIGRLLTAFQGMRQNLNALIAQVQNSVIQVTTSATKISASGKQLEATATEQVASTNEVVATSKEIAANSSELVRTMEEVAEIAQVTATDANSSQKDLVRMESTMRQLMAATDLISSKLEVISEKANNINSVVLTITKVADQTNLLSLNAAIEAEKAGEYGLGFAVVAREIRRLADQTAVATLDIEQMVKEMQSAVATGVMEMDKFAKEVGRGVEDVSNISLQLGQIIEQVQDLTPRFEDVSQGMEAQTQGAQQISEAMVQLSQASVQTADALREINNAIALLNNASQSLRQEISRFKVTTADLSQPAYLN